MNQKQLKKLLFILQPEFCSYGCTVGNDEEPSHKRVCRYRRQ
ncbi:hypothetical protein [Bacillus velezensis]|nr:hypothetical protein [Bacillus velezensis]MEC0930592.1 hypothetical protein [Bacillus velezensis]